MNETPKPAGWIDAPWADWAVMAGLIATWGSAYALLKVAVHEIPPVWNTAFRLWIGAATLGAIALARGLRLPPLLPRPDPVWWWYAFNGTIGTALPFYLYAMAAQGIPSAVSAICNGASPIFTLLFAWFAAADEQPSPRRIGGVLLGFGGLVVLVAPRLAQGASLETLALIAAIAGAVFYAMANVAIRRAPATAPVIGSLILCITGGLAATLVAAATAPLPPLPHAPALAALAFLGVGITGLATVGYVFVIQRRGPVFLSMAIYVSPLWATALGVLVMGERPGWNAFAALALILAGLALVTRPTRSDQIAEAG
jgi:drug/metabolite transporter (DMT)-like permease